MRKKTGKFESHGKNQSGMLFDNLSFACSEAYKLLRTNLMFTIPGDGDTSCKAIGITSSVRGEGKSMTALNLSYTIAQTGQRVLLVDTDLRIPTVATRLGLEPKPGLSDFLAGQQILKDIIRPSCVQESLDVIVAGTIPPNPSELLGSDNMKSALDQLRQRFDYIIFDLPPVMVVSDALVLSPILDGVILVARQDYVTRSAVAASVRTFEVQKSKLLGFVVTDAKDTSPRYKKYKYSKYRYYKYGNYYQSYGSYGTYGDYAKQAARQRAAAEKTKAAATKDSKP